MVRRAKKLLPLSCPNLARGSSRWIPPKCLGGGPAFLTVQYFPGGGSRLIRRTFVMKVET